MPMRAIGNLAKGAVQWITVNGRRFPIAAKYAKNLAGGIGKELVKRGAQAKGWLKGYPGNLNRFNKQWAKANRAKMQAARDAFQKQVAASKSVSKVAGVAKGPGVIGKAGRFVGGGLKRGWRGLGTIGKIGAGLAVPMGAWMAADYASDRIRRDLEPGYVSPYDQQAAAYRPKRKLYVNPMQALVPTFGQGLQGNYQGYAYAERMENYRYRDVKDEVDNIFGSKLTDEECAELARLIKDTVEDYNGDEIAIMANPEGFMHDYDFRQKARQFAEKDKDIKWITIGKKRIPIKKKHWNAALTGVQALGVAAPLGYLAWQHGIPERTGAWLVKRLTRNKGVMEELLYPRKGPRFQFADYRPNEKLIWVTYEGKRFPIREKQARVERRRFEKTVHRAIKSERHRARVQGFKDKIRDIVKNPENRDGAILVGGLLVTGLILRRIGPRVPEAARAKVRSTLQAVNTAIQQQKGLVRPGKEIMQQVTKGHANVRISKGKWIWGIPDRLKRGLARSKRMKIKAAAAKEVVKVPSKKEAKLAAKKIKAAIKAKKEKAIKPPKVEKKPLAPKVPKTEKQVKAAPKPERKPVEKVAKQEKPKIEKAAKPKPTKAEVKDIIKKQVAKKQVKAEVAKAIESKPPVVVKELPPAGFHKSSKARAEADLLRTRITNQRRELLNEAKKDRQDLGNKLLEVKNAPTQAKKKKLYAEALEIQKKVGVTEAKAIELKRNVLEEMDFDAQKGNYFVDKHRAKMNEILGNVEAKPAMPITPKIEPVPKAKKARIEKKPAVSSGKPEKKTESKPLFGRTPEQIKKDEDYLAWSKQKLAKMDVEEKAEAARKSAKVVKEVPEELKLPEGKIKAGTIIKKKIRGKKKK